MNQNIKVKIRLSKGVAQAFDSFIIHTNLSSGGPINNLTWEALYGFIEYTHSHNVRLGDDQLRDLLVNSGAKPEAAEETAIIYLHGRNLLYKKKAYDIQKMYSWLRSRKENETLKIDFKRKMIERK
jgi:hypothetical protein